MPNSVISNFRTVNKPIPKDRLKQILRWMGINLIIALLIPFFYATHLYFSLEGLSRLWDDVLYAYLMSSAISGTVGLIEGYLNPRLTWIDQPLKRVLVELLMVTVFAFSAVYAVNVAFYGSFGMVDFSNFPWKKMAAESVVPLLVGYLITAFFLSRSFLFNWREQAVAAEKMQSERLKSEVRLLRDQLNPHFLFNSLNVLTNLVYESADASADYIRQLSKFYRYVIEIQDEEVVRLAQELKFSQSFMQLQQTRFGTTALQLSLSLDVNQDLYLPPMAVQLLLENAIKHNRAEESKPLKISIRQADDYLVVENNLQPRSQPAESTGLGLGNIKKRYALLSTQSVKLESSESYFRVSLPLLKMP